MAGKKQSRPYRGHRRRQRKLAKQRRTDVGHVAAASEQQSPHSPGDISNAVQALASLTLRGGEQEHGVSEAEAFVGQQAPQPGGNVDRTKAPKKKSKPKIFHVPGRKLKVFRFRLDSVFAGRAVDYMAIRNFFAGSN